MQDIAQQSADDFLESTLNDSQHPVVVFALEWCEFCHSLRKMLKKCGIEYHSVDLDSAAYRENNWGRQIREALNRKTGMMTIPQVFVAGQLIGGCTEVFDAFRDGSLQKILDKAGMEYDKNVDSNPYSFLPDWVHPR